MATPISPFEGLLTPERLSGARRAERTAAYAEEPFWVRRAAAYGSDLKDALVARGIGLDENDRKAQRNSQIMQELSSDVDLKLKAGEITPQQAQRDMLEQALQTFVSIGDYEQAAQLAPALTALQKQEEEINKIRSEIGENQAQAASSLATGERQLTDAERLRQRTPFEVDLLRAQAERARRPDAPRGGGAGGGGLDDAPNRSDQAKYNNLLIGASGTFDRMGQLADLLLSSPGVASDAAGQLAAVQNQVKGAAQLADQTADPLGKQADAEVRMRQDAALAKLYNQKRGVLNIDRARFDSLTMDLAYTLAKARDPGGRLSDADVQNALKIIGAAGDSQAMTATMQDLVENTYKDLTRWRRIGGWYETHQGNAMVDEAYTGFKGVLDRYRKPAKGTGKAPPAGQKPAASPLDAKIDAILSGE